MKNSGMVLVSQRMSRRALRSASFLLLGVVCGCGSGGSTPSSASTTTPATPVSKGPLTFLAPQVGGATNGGATLQGAQIVVVDDSAGTFTQSTYLLNPPFQQGAQIINAGKTTSGPRGLLDLGLTANYTFNGTNQFVATTTNLPQGGFALEAANRGGGLLQLPNQPVEPFVPTTQCPTISTATTYRFLTIPGALLPANQSAQLFTWNPITDTAYGSVDISTDGSTVSLRNIKQFTLSGAVPATPAAASIAGACGPTAFGNTISIPGQVIVQTPGIPGPIPAQAIAEIGPTGLLIEDNGAAQAGGALVYQNSLGAGTGAVGVPIPSAALDTTGLVGAQYLGAVYGAGAVVQGAPTGWSSHLASFGFSASPPTCASVAPATSTLLYGGDFTNDMVSNGSNGFGNCNLAIDLKDQASPGLYPHATVFLAGGYAGGDPRNTTNTFSAIAIAGQLQGKFVIFVLGVDSTQPWAISLLQSN